MHKVAVVICNFNKKEDALACIASVFASAFRDVGVIVVDNASTDGSVDAIRKAYEGRLTLLANEENVGGAGGFGRGMEYAVEAGYQYVLCLDNDVVLDKDAIGALYHFMEKNPQAGACGSLVNNFDDPALTQEMGANINFEKLGYTALYAQQRNPSLPSQVECDYIAFCSAMLRAEALKKTGLMPTEYFIYWDDMELCWRIRSAGYKVYAISGSVVYHHANAIAPTTTFGAYYYFRNMVTCFARHLNDEQYHRLPDLLVERLYRIIVVNRDNQPIVTTYMHALNDALNGVMGKAGPGRILPFEAGAAVFLKKLQNMGRIRILHGTGFNRMDDLEQGLKNAGAQAVLRGDAADGRGGCDVVIQTCAHILDVPEYDRDAVYVDNHWNSITSPDDFDFYAGYRDGYDLFYKAHFQFIKDKLAELRQGF